MVGGGGVGGSGNKYQSHFNKPVAFRVCEWSFLFWRWGLIGVRGEGVIIKIELEVIQQQVSLIL